MSEEAPLWEIRIVGGDGQTLYKYLTTVDPGDVRLEVTKR